MFQGVRILIADDEEGIREFLAYDLRYQSAQVFEAGNAVEALKIIENETIDLIISDIQMPGGDGVQLLRTIHERGLVLPIVIITGFAEISREELLRLGAVEVLDKPIDESRLWELLQKIITQLQAQRHFPSVTLAPQSAETKSA